MQEGLDTARDNNNGNLLCPSYLAHVYTSPLMRAPLAFSSWPGHSSHNHPVRYRGTRRGGAWWHATGHGPLGTMQGGLHRLEAAGEAGERFWRLLEAAGGCWSLLESAGDCKRNDGTGSTGC